MNAPEIHMFEGTLRVCCNGETGLLGYVKSSELHGSESIQLQYTEQIAALRIEALHPKSEFENQRVSFQDVSAFVQEIENLRAEQVSYDERACTLYKCLLMFEMLRSFV